MSVQENKVNMVDQEVLKSANDTIASWLANHVEGVQFLKNSIWKIDDEVFLNTKKDKGYLLLLNQDKDPDAELDYVQTLYTARENGTWTLYLASLPNIVVARKKENGRLKANSLADLSAAGKKEINSRYKNSLGGINDDFIEQEYTPDLKKNHALFLAKKIKN
ncbi:MAG TPA: hypothetical protein VGC08_08025 [Pedobacter sp.]